MPDGWSFDADDVATDIGGIDTDVLEQIGQRLSRSQRFSKVVFQPAYAPSSVVAHYDMGYFPAAVDRAYLQIRWYETDNFSIHYSEQYDAGNEWECRWDRHPNDHNARVHVHRPPDAATPGDDTTFARDWRDVLSRVLESIDDRIKAFWE